MKKIITLIAAAAMLAVSCQKETPETYTAGSTDNQSAPGKLTATIAQTKVSYAEEGNNLQPAWEVGDEIIGFDDAGSTYTFTVASITDGTATLYADKEINDGTYHLIYKSGASASDISAKSLAIDYTAQIGDKTMPAVMLADGTVINGICEFEFANAGAIIGISAVKGVPQDAKVTKITVEGENLSAATVALNGSALKLTATTKTGDAISVDDLDLTVTDANGTLSAPVFIAVPAGAKIKKVTVPVTKEPETMTIPSTAADKKGIDYVEIEAKYDGTNLSTKKWAKWNVGANSQTDYGWYFPWAGTEGYVHKGNKFLSASGVDSYYYTLSSAKTAVASDYLYVKTQSFTTAGHSFDWAHAPFNNGSSSYDETYFNSVKNTVCPDNTLALEYDAARANWHGSWRMPTSAEFQALYDATEWTWDDTDKGYYVTKKGEALSADKANALLFFPAAGVGLNGSFLNAGSYGFYWSSSLYSSSPSSAHSLRFLYSGSVYPQFSLLRYSGHSVRPLSDEKSSSDYGYPTETEEENDN